MGAKINIFNKIISFLKALLESMKRYYNKSIYFLVKRFRNKFAVFVLILAGILILSWVISYCLSYFHFPSWNSNIDTTEKMLAVPSHKIAAAAFRLLLTIFFVFLYWEASLPFWRENPIERDRSLFARSGWGMATYSLGAILMVVSILMTTSNLMGAETVYVPNADNVLKTNYNGKFGIIKRSWDVICQFADPGNIHSSTNLQGNIIALLCALAGILCLSGLAVSALVSMIARRTQQWKNGLLHYDKGFDNYVVIIGCNEQTANIVRRSLNRKINGKSVQYVLIQTRQNVERVRHELELKLNVAEEEKIVFYSGERTSQEDIEHLRLEKALEIYILGEDMQQENEEDHDTYNINCLDLISEYMKDREINKVKCHVNFEYQSTYTVFKSINIYMKSDSKLEFLPFNIHDIWAKKVLVDNYAVVPDKDGNRSVERYLPLDNYGIHESSERRVHFFIVGMNQMGTALGIQAALIAHYPNFHRNHDLRTTITFIDDQALKEGEFFRGRFAQLFSLCRFRSLTVREVKHRDSVEWIDPIVDSDFAYKHTTPVGSDFHNFLDIQWEFIQGNVASEEIQNYMIEEVEKPLLCDHVKNEKEGEMKQNECTVAICLNNPQQSAAAAVYLPERLLKRVNQVLVYQQNKFELINMVSASELEWKRYEKLKPFGMLEDCYIKNMFEDIRAQLVHRLYYKNDDITAPKTNEPKEQQEALAMLDSEIDEMKRHWDELDMSSKLANINLIDSFGTKLRSLGIIRYKNIETLSFNDRTRMLRTFSDGIREDIEEKLKVSIDETPKEDRYMVKIEHTRWLTERLIMGYRPVNSKELRQLQDLENDETEFLNKKDSLKVKNRAHLDICSNAELHNIDKLIGRKNNDERIVKKLTYVINTADLILSRLALRGEDVSYNNPYDEEGLARDLLKKMKFLDFKSSFWISSETVTEDFWDRVILMKERKKGSKKPKTNVSKERAEDFIRTLNYLTGLCFRLPTKLEWEAAAQYSGQEKSFTRKKGRNEPCNVDENEFCGNGLYHMLGNVWEWTSDNLEYEGKKGKGSKREKKTERSFVYCGGSFMYGEEDCKIKGNNWYNYGLSDFKSDDLGFRLLLSHKYEVEPLKDEKQSLATQTISDLIDQMFDSENDGEQIMLEIKMITDKDSESNYRFCQGSNSWLPEEKYAHFVKFYTDKMYIGRYPVTQKLWKAIMGENPSVIKNDNAPVVNVSFKDVQCFMNKLNEELKKSKFYQKLPEELKGWKFRLPSEAEWEYIAKGGATHFEIERDCYDDANKWSQKDPVFCGSENADEVAWHYGITRSIHPVGKKKGSVVVDKATIDAKRKETRIVNEEDEKIFMRQFMVFDMCGNVWEWCVDDFDADAYKKEITENYKICEIQEVDPDDDCCNPAHNKPRYSGIFYQYEGNDDGFVHSARGGSWKCLADECRVTRVNRYLSSYKSDDLGFRLVFADVDFIINVKNNNRNI